MDKPKDKPVDKPLPQMDEVLKRMLASKPTPKKKLATDGKKAAEAPSS